MNARDLSEPPKNGTTSGCPPPSQHHNYRRPLHTQQRNRLERYQTDRFWTGVAQITRSRDRIFIASLCSIKLFSVSRILGADRCVGTRLIGFPPRARLFAPNRVTEAKTVTAKMIRETNSENDPSLMRYLSSGGGTHDVPNCLRFSLHPLLRKFDRAHAGMAETLVFRARNPGSRLRREQPTSVHCTDSMVCATAPTSHFGFHGFS
jgi:hypothetical protein